MLAPIAQSAHFRAAHGKSDPMKREVMIHIGGLHASRKPAVVYTVLGSCVAVCFYDPVERVGGMNHILLPGSADMKQFDSTARYGINAMELLINMIMKLGGERCRLVAKAFGGAHILPTITEENSVARKNIEFVLEFLRMESIRLVSWDLGGHEPRRVYFRTDTGEVLLNRIPSSHYPKVVMGERVLFEEVCRKSKKPGKISLFTHGLIKRESSGSNGLKSPDFSD